MKSPRTRVYNILHALWCDIPADDNAFANNFIQAIATTDPSKGYRPELLRATLKRVTAMLHDALPDERRSRAAVNRIANVVMMAFDGYVIGRHLNPRRGLRPRHHPSVRRSAHLATSQAASQNVARRIIEHRSLLTSARCASGIIQMLAGIVARAKRLDQGFSCRPTNIRPRSRSPRSAPNIMTRSAPRPRRARHRDRLWRRPLSGASPSCRPTIRMATCSLRCMAAAGPTATRNGCCSWRRR